MKNRYMAAVPESGTGFRLSDLETFVKAAHNAGAPPSARIVMDHDQWLVKDRLSARWQVEDDDPVDQLARNLQSVGPDELPSGYYRHLAEQMIEEGT